MKKRRLTPETKGKVTEKELSFLINLRDNRETLINYNKEFQLILLQRGFDSSIWNVDFPKWLEKYNLINLEFTYNIWQSLLENFLEDERIARGKNKCSARLIVESVEKIVNQHRELLREHYC
jgi:hypothetical protein